MEPAVSQPASPPASAPSRRRTKASLELAEALAQRRRVLAQPVADGVEHRRQGVDGQLGVGELGRLVR